ncbi:MAG TPA: carboxypeptidase-like regulatory domain-containing protein [Blastocatellia bacterium]|nr:carboxypeptidase-like regulatory domain-containing protein [Blastocatellia bacterium]
MRQSNFFRFALAFTLIVAQLPPSVLARVVPDTITGTLVGRVINADGATLPGVRIIATNQETGNQRATLTSPEGRYQITFLPLGVYTIEAWSEGMVVVKPTRQPIKTALNKTVETVPDITLGPTAPAATTPQPAQAQVEEVGQLVNLTDATRRANTDDRTASLLPLAAVRSFDELALLAPGVAPPPEVKGVAGPGLGAGIGTAGQFSVNGQRARSNNFTVDGSDNNDEDVGVRRQGFASLIPQSIESIREFQIVTSLWDAEQGRNPGSQVNAVSKSGTRELHGSVYGFFNHDALNARNFFDYAQDQAPASYALTAVPRSFDPPPSPTRVPVILFGPGAPGGQAVRLSNPSEDKDHYLRHQDGVAFGLPFSKKYFGPLGSGDPARTFFFGSFERQEVRARQETHFSVPTVEQRGFFGLGASGYSIDQSRFPPTSAAGDAVFSLFPFANNPIGPYGENTFTQVLPAKATGTIFSLKFDHNFTLFGPEVRHTLTGRYNFTNDRHEVPAVGGAIFSGVEPRVGTQNLSLFLNSQLTPRVASQLRSSFGRTRLRFAALRNPLNLPSQLITNDPVNSPYLLNRLVLANYSSTILAPPGSAPFRFPFASYTTLTDDSGQLATTEAFLGPAGQLVVTPFSAVGADTTLFPQARANNTIQAAETLTLFRGNHTFKFGTDIRRTQLNSMLNRNFRPQIVFGGAPDLSGSSLFDPLFAQQPVLDSFRQLTFRVTAKGNPFSPTPGFYSGSDLAALGVPTGIFQALTTGKTDTAIALRFWQQNFFFNDNWCIRHGLTLDYGLRYEYNSVPREANNRIEQTFSGSNLPAPDPSLNLRLRYPRLPDRVVASQQLVSAFEVSRRALEQFLDGREGIYDPDRNNFGPHIGFAWDPFASSSTQAGKTAVRGGAGIYYDLALGNVVSQSRNVFPNFIPFSLDSSTFDITQSYVKPPPGFPSKGLQNVFNPFFSIFGTQGRVCPDVTAEGLFGCTLLTKDGRLNVIALPPGAVVPVLGVLFDSPALSGQPSGSGLAFTLPDRHLRSPYALHFNLQLERELSSDYLVNVAYVGTRGIRLTRFRTPNGGLNSLLVPFDILGLTLDREREKRALPAISLPPLPGKNFFYRPTPGLGAYTVFDSSAASNYHSLQVGVTKRFSKGWQMSGTYTWSHAIDDVSDVFDVAGAYNLPQDDSNLRAERGNANFDIRHRFVLSTISHLPFLARFDNAAGVRGLLLGGWQLAQVSTFQTGQPFTVNTSFDINLDGNLTDRIDTLNGLEVSDDRQQRLRLTAPLATALLPQDNGRFTLRDGRVGRNTFRGSGVLKTDLTLIKNFRVKEGWSFVLRIEAFNLFNRTHFGLPVRILEAPAFGRSVDTSVNPRQVQFALKFAF